MKDFKKKLLNLDRYGKDVDEFTELVNSIPNDASDQVTDILFQTFNNDDDYGIQETVLTKLDSLSDSKFVAGLIRNFQNILKKSSKQEWPLLM